MKPEQTTQLKLLAAFDKSEKKSVTDVCRIAGVTRGTFYFHFYKDSNFRKRVLEKQQEHLEKQLSA